MWFEVRVVELVGTLKSTFQFISVLPTYLPPLRYFITGKQIFKNKTKYN
jgi:hypothetical protein